ncbi:hypothetical protein AVEN_157358-1 [Araneus ventricosus]|uniref:Uncharacterized protein n=1 Tax=Araneus ventricosus TaxID=182803 RepID=A0A4Y2GYG9_ARAVE|nr:hypothetical protein AVEN_157358-1 [Araneus ventricosus]
MESWKVCNSKGLRDQDRILRFMSLTKKNSSEALLTWRHSSQVYASVMVQEDQNYSLILRLAFTSINRSIALFLQMRFGKMSQDLLLKKLIFGHPEKYSINALADDEIT